MKRGTSPSVGSDRAQSRAASRAQTAQYIGRAWGVRIQVTVPSVPVYSGEVSRTAWTTRVEHFPVTVCDSVGLWHPTTMSDLPEIRAKPDLPLWGEATAKPAGSSSRRFGENDRNVDGTSATRWSTTSPIAPPRVGQKRQFTIRARRERRCVVHRRGVATRLAKADHRGAFHDWVG